jgi:hypothetical protein
MYSMSRKFKKFTLHYAYLLLEKEEVDEVCIKVEKEMRDYLEEHYPQYYAQIYAPTKPPNPSPDTEAVDPIGDSPPEKPKDNETTEEKEKEITEIDIPSPPKNKDLKKLYRKIAAKTHPDKIGGNQHASLFSEAAAAYKNNDLASLLHLAGKVNIELTELSDESLQLLHNNIKSLSDHIHIKKTTTAWAWHMSSSEEQKRQVILNTLKFKGIKIENE